MVASSASGNLYRDSHSSSVSDVVVCSILYCVWLDVRDKL